jgi:hypothetical protein
MCTEVTLHRRKREASEERKARKAEKKRLRAEEEARQVAELSVYSATDNPFHDVNLGQQFRWHKKAEKERKQGLSMAESQRRDLIRRQEAKEELERLNKRRADREAEQRLREQEELKMQRLNESVQMSSWLAKDDDFQLDQERQRAVIRIKERRAKAVDFLALNLRYANPDPDEDGEDGEFDLDAAGVEIDLDEPYNIFDVSFPFPWRPDFACLPCFRTCLRNRLTNSMTISNAIWLWRSRNTTSNFGRWVHSHTPPLINN